MTETELECLAEIAEAMCDYLTDLPYVCYQVVSAMDYLDDVLYADELVSVGFGARTDK